MSIYSVSISARLTLDMHSLNNEGGESNHIQTRMVNIVDGNGKLHSVNAVSGDMLKHILAEHLHRLSVNVRAPLCSGCRTLNANRISVDDGYMAAIANVGDVEAINILLQHCAMDDMLGNLVTTKAVKGSKSGKKAKPASEEAEDSDTPDKKGRSLARKSVVEFGWLVGLPDKTRTDSFFHVKFSDERDTEAIKGQSSDEAKGKNLGQVPFHRPASSGVYALVATIEVARIGFNDKSQTYSLDETERQKRFKLLLESLLYTLVEPSGAMRATQAPHIVDVTGVLTVSRDVAPAPTFSPLKDGYEAELALLCKTLNEIRPGALEARAFGTLNECAQHVSGLLKETPYSLKYKG